MSDFTLTPAGRQWNVQMERWEPVTRIQDNTPLGMRNASRRSSGSGSMDGVDGGFAAFLVVGAIFVGVFIAVAFIAKQVVRLVKHLHGRYKASKATVAAPVPTPAPVKAATNDSNSLRAVLPIPVREQQMPLDFGIEQTSNSS